MKYLAALITAVLANSAVAQGNVETRALLDTNGDGNIDLVEREFRDQLREQEQISFGANFVYEGMMLGANQRTAFGLDVYKGTEDALLGGTAGTSDGLIY